MAESIQCYQCGTRMTLEELAINYGDCPECDVEIHLAEYLSKALADIAVLRTQQSSQGGEAVAEYQQLSRYNNWDRIDKSVFDLGMLGSCPERFRALYTHPPTTPADSRVVPVELLRSMLVDLESGMMCNPDHSQLQQLRALVEQNQLPSQPTT